MKFIYFTIFQGSTVPDDGQSIITDSPRKEVKPNTEPSRLDRDFSQSL